jgi:calcineurin-like phosphoesterase family protein
MSRVWFTADTPFGHDSIIKHSARPFSNTAEMDAAMIAIWNSVVRPDDEVYHLGDFSFKLDNDKRLAKIFRGLNGHKHLVLGNHDHEAVTRLGWFTVDKLKGVKIDGQAIVLCHYAMRTWPKAHNGAIHLYGHTHGTLPGTSASLDVGVDCWDFRPVGLDEIRLRLAETSELEPESAGFVP